MDIDLPMDIGLIEASDLNKNLSAWAVLDARPKTEWQAGRVPGAWSFSWEDYTRTDERGVQYKILPFEKLAESLGRMGIDEKTPVVVYGDADKSWGGEGWSCWALARLGHKGPLRLLAGGIQAWRNQGLPIETGAEKNERRERAYKATPRLQMDVAIEEINRTNRPFILVDVRSLGERLLGRIQGSIHIDWAKFYQGPDRRPISPAALRELLEKNGINAEAPVVYYCTGGVRSAYAWLVHQLSGLPNARSFEGGMEEWKNIKTGK